MLVWKCRASAAASRAQYSLQGAAEADAHDLASRIANAEAAVEQAEQAAAEAVRSQDEASRAATMADKHYMDAADQADTVYRVSLGLQRYDLGYLPSAIFEQYMHQYSG